MSTAIVQDIKSVIAKLEMVHEEKNWRRFGDTRKDIMNAIAELDDIVDRIHSEEVDDSIASGEPLEEEG